MWQNKVSRLQMAREVVPTRRHNGTESWKVRSDIFLFFSNLINDWMSDVATSQEVDTQIFLPVHQVIR